MYLDQDSQKIWIKKKMAAIQIKDQGELDKNGLYINRSFR